MSQPLPPPMPTLIPESAPFTGEQRAWLNGFFAGLVSLESAGITPLSPEQNAALMASGVAPAALQNEDDAETPWHDQSLAISARMQLAEGKPLRWRLMAAMAQQDCGQCGSDCKTYSKAIFEKREERLNLCAPGGKDTTRMLKALASEIDASPPATLPAQASVPAAARDSGETAFSRDHPGEAVFLSRRRLNKPGSEKETWHIEFDIARSNLEYQVGDSFGVFPENDPQLADSILQALGVPPDFPIAGHPLRDVLIGEVSLAPAPDMLFQLFSYVTGGERRQKAKALASGEDPDGDAATLDVLAAIEKFRGVCPDPEAFVEALEPLQPRLYSISSSPKVTPGRVALTVDTVRYALAGRVRRGVASCFLGERAVPGLSLKAYVQKAHAFGLPADTSIPIIMIGPGTGVAPFRAFLHERMATKAPGRNWLFFGHQRSEHDFFYADELSGMRSTGLLTRLSLAWSRDGHQKFYVQDRMREVGRDLWSWLADGAHFYVCGDAQRMAKDVERALVDIVAQFGARTVDEAVAFVAELKKSGRYQQDVY